MPFDGGSETGMGQTVRPACEEMDMYRCAFLVVLVVVGTGWAQQSTVGVSLMKLADGAGETEFDFEVTG